MITLPINLTAVQQDKLQALILRGEPSLVVIDENVNGSKLYVVIARGDAREWAMEKLYGGATAEAAAPAPPPFEPPAPKPVAISDGVRAAGIPAKKSELMAPAVPEHTTLVPHDIADVPPITVETEPVETAVILDDPVLHELWAES